MMCLYNKYPKWAIYFVRLTDPDLHAKNYIEIRSKSSEPNLLIRLR